MAYNSTAPGNNYNKLIILFLFISGLFLKACDQNPTDITLGEEFIETQSDLALIDTFSVNLSTVIFDDVETSGTSDILIGNYRDDVVGRITSHSYFELGIPSVDDIYNDDTYDSLNLVITYNGYSFGDTTQYQKISVHQLTENIKLDEDEVITSNTQFNYNPAPIGSIVYTPVPNGTVDTLAIKISDEIGLELFEMLKDDSETLTENELFKNYFHGLALIADENYNGAIVGFNASSVDVNLVLYTTRTSPSLERINYKFGLSNTDQQFNNIIHDFTSTQFSLLTEQRNELPSVNSNGMSVLQGGIGLAIRVDFPYLKEILLNEHGFVMKAELAISPLQNSYNDSDLPSTLNICAVDKQNEEITVTISSSTLSIDDLYNEDTEYIFDLTEYLNYDLKDSYINPENGFIITLPSESQISSFERLIADAKNNKPKLLIYYLSY